ncbi:MAG TPA: IS481 family transposase [Spirochaetota bacterium]|nr:IS481 family transposase [Spirochaetota bacterium]HPC42326.1 IS481 family transposase [Spirochaetota bacterium]HPL17860.1 IS481 family transposase [Spirochaetota bacterium]HQF10225.1 IS481 family transposase [Spirochaetota bacterium]HQH99371.1 IS481 family transposase [Spirochaetota bacterium]
MTANANVTQKAARRKLNLLELAQELDNVSKACMIMGYSRHRFYEIRRNFQTYGAEGLLDRIPGAKGPHPNRVSEDVEEAILDCSLKHPTKGCLSVAQQLNLQGVKASSGGVRGVWLRNKLETRHQRLMRLEEHQRDTQIELTEEQVRLLEKFSPEYRERHIQADFTGHLVAMDAFLVGTLKGIGRVYLQTVIDCHSRYARGRMYTTKVPVTAVQTLNNYVLPFFEEHNVKVETVLTDNGRGYCGRPEKHPFELFLQLEDIEHRATKVRRPQSNGYVGRLHRTFLDGRFRIAGRTNFYESVQEMQNDFDTYLEHYNNERSHQGRNMNGRTPYQAFVEGIRPFENEPMEMDSVA